MAQRTAMQAQHLKQTDGFTNAPKCGKTAFRKQGWERADPPWLFYKSQIRNLNIFLRLACRSLKVPWLGSGCQPCQARGVPTLELELPASFRIGPLKATSRVHPSSFSSKQQAAVLGSSRLLEHILRADRNCISGTDLLPSTKPRENATITSCSRERGARVGLLSRIYVE